MTSIEDFLNNRRHRSMNYAFEDEDVVSNEYIDYWLSTAWD